MQWFIKLSFLTLKWKRLLSVSFTFILIINIIIIIIIFLHYVPGFQLSPSVQHDLK